MAKINFQSCMIFDAICYIEKRHLQNRDNLLPKQIGFIEKINHLTENKLDAFYLDMVSLCNIISTYTLNQKLEIYTLNDLIDIFKKPQQVIKRVRERTNTEFTVNGISLLEQLKEGFADKYVAMLSVLKDIGFEQLWQQELFPETQMEINKMDDFMNYVYPHDCVLHNFSFLTAPPASKDGDFDIITIAAHELMHSFISEELIEIYREYTKKDDYLKEQYSILNKKYKSGDEEVFVTAAEYYLVYLSGHKTKEELIEAGKNRYDGCMPLLLIIFEKLLKELTVPHNYNDWLIKRFRNNEFSVSNIKEYIAAL